MPETETKTTKKARTKKPSARKPKGAKKRGRPPGTPNTPKPTVTAIPSRCPRCHATGAEVVKGSSPRERIQAGTLPGLGIRFTSITYRRKQCGQCGQVFEEKSYQFDPEAWDGKK